MNFEKKDCRVDGAHPLVQLSSWFKGTCLRIIDDFGSSILEDLPQFVSELRDEQPCLYDGSESKCPINYSDVDIEFLSQDSIYTDPVDRDQCYDFDGYVYHEDEAGCLLKQFPTLSMRVTHYSGISGVETAILLKRILFKLDRIRLEEESMVMVEKSVVLVEDGDDFVELH